MSAQEGSAVKTARKVVSYKDIQIAYLLDGLAGVEELVPQKGTGSVVKRALQELRAQGHQADDLANFVVSRYGSTGRGRSVPQRGEQRTYRAQQIKNGSPFLRLPLNTLEIPKGKAVRVSFESSQIVISSE